MKTAFRSSDQAYRLGIGVGQSAADMLRIEIVAAVYSGTMNAGDLRAEAGAFADDFERGWWDGLRSRCSDIIERLNTHSDLRLPEPAAVADDGWDGD